jgi:hypothetical protein
MFGRLRHVCRQPKSLSASMHGGRSLLGQVCVRPAWPSAKPPGRTCPPPWLRHAQHTARPHRSLASGALGRSRAGLCCGGLRHLRRPLRSLGPWPRWSRPAGPLAENPAGLYGGQWVILPAAGVVVIRAARGVVKHLAARFARKLWNPACPARFARLAAPRVAAHLAVLFCCCPFCPQAGGRPGGPPASFDALRASPVRRDARCARRAAKAKAKAQRLRLRSGWGAVGAGTPAQSRCPN